jgi:hypothetical protein
MNLWTNVMTPGRDRAARVTATPDTNSVRVAILTGSSRNADPMTVAATIAVSPDIARVMAGRLIEAAEAVERARR